MRAFTQEAKSCSIHVMLFVIMVIRIPTIQKRKNKKPIKAASGYFDPKSHVFQSNMERAKMHAKVIGASACTCPAFVRLQIVF